ncbi:lactonase family protein [Vibrio maerlii]|uniref:lactonase family protein n=1 Tax=Vibrio maerlii TaxID=2231648 RepID=UPI0013E00615|nr:lactonase family protein [Vibrio maerlii]
MEPITLLIGCYTNNNTLSKGVQTISFDPADGSFSHKQSLLECDNPSFVTKVENGFYAITELTKQEQPQLVFRSNDNLNNQHDIDGDHPCHIAVSNKFGLIVTSQYTSGSFDIFTRDSTGSISERLATLIMSGSSIHPKRQTAPHAHQAVFLETRDQMATVDLGGDKIRLFDIQRSESGQYSFPEAETIVLPAGSGPRHLVFNSTEEMLYILCELTEELFVAQRDNGKWNLVQQLKLLPDTEIGEAAAAIKLSSDSRFLYTSSRKQSRISCFAVNQESGLVEYKDSYSTQGVFPRDFAIIANGEWLITANQHSNDMASFKVNKETGTLMFSGNKVEIGEPVCIVEC